MMTMQGLLNIAESKLTDGEGGQIPVSSLLCLSQKSSLSIDSLLHATGISAVVFVEQVDLLARGDSKQLMALAEIIAHAINVFGNIEKATSWLGESIQALNGDSPLSRMSVSGGKAQIRDILYRIEYGAFS